MPILPAQRIARLDIHRIDDNVLDALAFPSVRHVDESIVRLNDRRIAEFGLFFLLQHSHLAPLDAVVEMARFSRPRRPQPVFPEPRWL